MTAIIRRPTWAVAESGATPEDVFWSRRSLLKTAGFAGLSALAGQRALAPHAARAEVGGEDIAALRGKPGPLAGRYPAPRNGRYRLDRDITEERFNLTYNNFYEFGSHKTIWPAAQALVIDPWSIRIDGLVKTERTVAFEALMRGVALEERLYRHRCVEAWAMAVPWTGFAFSELMRIAEPLGSARYVRMETFLEPDIASGQDQVWYPWPYVEGMTIEEAANELAFVVTGAYGKPLARQMGAPIRLALPWKYGFKSIKSIRRVTFTDSRPVSFWESVAPQEYGFWANVNPGVPHRRWRQHQERMLGTGLYRRTELFNGYGDQVAALYAGIKGEAIYY